MADDGALTEAEQIRRLAQANLIAEFALRAKMAGMLDVMPRGATFDYYLATIGPKLRARTRGPAPFAEEAARVTAKVIDAFPGNDELVRATVTSLLVIAEGRG